ncbi:MULTISPECIES: hypothetical protein [unclassified Rathayibacter]|uniref:hypothetical protein n=1 Tax=unclassified Rathayibacter TaxID=2609250 RepID=UPI001052D13E|nr:MULTISPECIES: hypothetical protein [unclassified Rathayibacter]TCL84807.1 hypothetical protein EDF49_102480 [Rathayibacter sp. PhB192]TCM30525.1 hypothetical protein EDF43_102480 [Rathayibacter sp. PhB179]
MTDASGEDAITPSGLPRSPNRTTPRPTDLDVMTVDRDRWRTLARRHEARVQAERSARSDILGELAHHVVAALRGAGYIQIDPTGTPVVPEQEHE